MKLPNSPHVKVITHHRSRMKVTCVKRDYTWLFIVKYVSFTAVLFGHFMIFSVLKGSLCFIFWPFFSYGSIYIIWLREQHFRKSQEPAVDKLKEPILDEITSALVGRYGLNFTRQVTSSLWFLCKQVITFLYSQLLMVFCVFFFWVHIIIYQCRGDWLFSFLSVPLSNLWLFWQQASLLDITNQACSLFSPAEVLL